VTDEHPPDAQITLLQRQIEQLTRERDKAVSARDLLVRELIAPGRVGSESGGRRRALPMLLAMVLLLGLGLLVMQMARTGHLLTTTAVGTQSPVLPLAPPAGPAANRTAMTSSRLVVIPVVEVSLLTRAVLAPDGHRVALGGLDGRILLRDLNTDARLWIVHGHPAGVRDLAFSPDGSRLYSGGADGAVHEWDTRKGRRLRTLRPRGNPVRRLEPCGAWLAVAAEQPTLELLDLRSGASTQLQGHTGWVRAVACSRDGGRLASGGHDGAIRIWSMTRSPTLEQTLAGHGLWVSALAFAPNGLLASGGFDRRVRLWDLAQDRMRRELRGHVRWISDLAFDGRGVQLASASMDRTARIWNVSDGRLRAELVGHRHGLTSVGFSPTGNVVTASTDGTLRVWPLPLPTPQSMAPLPSVGAGEITLRSYTSGERLRVLVMDGVDKVSERGRTRLAAILRSGPDDLSSPPAPALVRLLYRVADHFGRQREIWVISGYRSPQYNALRTRQSRQVGRESRHMQGEAIDFRIDGIPLHTLRQFLVKLRAGGVGFYPDSNFVHMDVGPVRTWNGT